MIDQVFTKISFVLFGQDWELEIVNIQTKCQKLAAEENAERRKNGIGKRAVWTEMLTIVDYKNIIEKYWSTKKDGVENYLSFDKIFAIDIGEKFNSKSDKTRNYIFLEELNLCFCLEYLDK